MDVRRLAALSRETGCEIRSDDLTRQLFATDASIHQMTPLAVAFPRGGAEAAAVMQGAAVEGVPIIPRGAGSGLCGGAIGDGLVLDFSRHNRGIHDFNPEVRTVRVEAGVVLDQLNAFVGGHGLSFGPDVATSSRATFGGMIANNSSGARAPLYGTTIDHVISLEAALTDGRIVELGVDRGGMHEHLDSIDSLIQAHAPEIRERFHEGIVKRWPGYALDRYLRAPRDLSKLMAGSEGTLASILSATIRLVPLPKSKGIGLVFFDTLEAAMEATVELLDMNPAGIEHIDDVLFNQTRGQLAFKAARDLLELDAKPCKSILLVEFYEDELDKLDQLERRAIGVRKHICRSAAEMNHVWNLRKAGLSLLTGRAGPAKPVAGIEDAAVPPAKLPEYVAGVRELMAPLGLDASYYGHAASGLLHIRPVIDLHRAEDIAKFRTLSEGVSALVRQFRGSFTAEHGVGISHTEFMDEHIGPELLGVMRRIKEIFDPGDVMNPGRIFDDGRFKIDNYLRQGADAKIDLPFAPKLAFAAKDKSFVGNLEQCNGCGGCRKDAPTMCPTFIATGEEIMSTRGRANVIRAVLEARLGSGENPVLSAELDEAISNCLSCKACTTECPSNVNMALLKAELLYARLKTTGVPLGTRLISRVDLLGELASMAPRLANASMQWRWLRRLLEKATGLSTRRPLPAYAPQPFHRWFRQRKTKSLRVVRGQVILWDDCFVRYNEPEIGRAAVRVLEAAGFAVRLLEGRACCGRPAFSMGRLDIAENFGRRNLALLEGGKDLILFLEPSCYSMFKEDYRELGLKGAEALSERAVLFEDFMAQTLEEAPDALCFKPAAASTAIHAHCHCKAITGAGNMPRLAARIPENRVTMLDTGCCGMAGAFGALENKYDLSVKVAEPLVRLVQGLAPGTRLIASGTSCRHQIEHLTGAQPLHMAELLSEALMEDGDP